jgi:molybdate transport system substrate-binding protein
MGRQTRLVCSLLGVAWLLGTGVVRADSATIAVAANFIGPLEALKPEFTQRTGHDLVTVPGSTGQLYAQIVNGAPFDVLLAADTDHPSKLVAAGFAAADRQFTYATGRLVLWTRATDEFAPLTLASLRRADYRWLAIANPELAPYGLAAEQTLRMLGLWDSIQSRLVRGQNIAQTFALVETRNADLGFVALSQALVYSKPAAYVEVPSRLYAPIRQDALLLKRGETNAAARAFVEFLASPEGRALIERFGYGTQPSRAPSR